MRTNVHILRYLWEISRELPGSWKQKKQILSRMERSIRDFVIENASVDYHAIVKRFGAPRQIAESYITEMETSELLEGMRIRQKILLVAIGAVVLLVIMRFGFLLAAYLGFDKDMRGYAVVEITEVARNTIDEGETE